MGEAYGRQALRLSSASSGFSRLTVFCSVLHPDAEIKIKKIKEKKNKERVGPAKTSERGNNEVGIHASPPIGEYQLFQMSMRVP